MFIDHSKISEDGFTSLILTDSERGTDYNHLRELLNRYDRLSSFEPGGPAPLEVQEAAEKEARNFFYDHLLKSILAELKLNVRYNGEHLVHAVSLAGAKRMNVLCATLTAHTVYTDKGEFVNDEGYSPFLIFNFLNDGLEYKCFLKPVGRAIFAEVIPVLVGKVFKRFERPDSGILFVRYASSWATRCDDDLEIKGATISHVLNVSRVICEKLNHANLWQDMREFLDTEKRLIALLVRIVPDKGAQTQIKQTIDLKLVKSIL